MKERLFTDTTNFFAIDYGDIIQLADKRFIVKGHERESRFGIDEPKFWVKKAVDTDTGERKIIKLAFFESFETHLGGIKIRCYRDPEKEGDVLKLVKDHPCFMQGLVYRDSEENIVRVLDVVKGTNFFSYIGSLDLDHEIYFRTLLPSILKNIVKAFEAIGYLHTHGLRHGDIRNDHLIVERDTGNYVWIDFDYNFDSTENPFGLDVFGLGNVLLYSIGKGFHNLNMIEKDTSIYGDLKDSLKEDDFSLLHKWRLFNLRKLYPYIPVVLNNILVHFSIGAEVFYESVEEIIEDINRCLHSVFEQ